MSEVQRPAERKEGRKGGEMYGGEERGKKELRGVKLEVEKRREWQIGGTERGK